jgi:uncharacterized protein
MYDFGFLAPCPSSGLVVHGDSDEIVPKEAVQKLVAKLSSQRDITITHRVIPGANHFFYNHLPQLEQAVEKYLDQAGARA